MTRSPSFLEEVQVWPESTCYCLLVLLLWDAKLRPDLRRARQISRDFAHTEKLIKQKGNMSPSNFSSRSDRKNNRRLRHQNQLPESWKLCRVTLSLNRRFPAIPVLLVIVLGLLMFWLKSFESHDPWPNWFTPDRFIILWQQRPDLRGGIRNKTTSGKD